MWTNNSGGYVTNTQFVGEIPENPNASHIESIWKIDPTINSGYPYITLMQDLQKLELTPVKQKRYIHIYCPHESSGHTVYPTKDEMDDATGATTNGDWILTPTSCEVTEEHNGMWSVSMVHPIDPEGRYKSIQINSILKVMGQLFTIKKVDEKWNGSSGKVNVYAEHIFYQQNDGWIFPGKRVNGATGQMVIDNAAIRVDYQVREDPAPTIYEFDGRSHMDFDSPGYTKIVEDGCTMIECLLGSGGMTEQYGGELYRNNFYYSIEERMEHANDDAFDIRIGKNLTGIDRTVDMSSMITYYRAIDNYGSWRAWAWNYSSFFGDIFPHYVVRSESCQVPQEVEDGTMSYSEWLSLLARKADAGLKKYGKPIICYDISMQDVRDNSDFAITADETLRVGDKGKLYDERLGNPITIEITKTVYDGIREKCKRIIVGDKQSFVATSIQSVDFNIEPVPEATVSPMLDGNANFMIDGSGKRIVIGGTSSNV